MMLRNIGECPICLKVAHEVTMNQDNKRGSFWCCGAACCLECFGKYAMKVDPTASTKDQQRLMKSFETKNPCPLCRGRFWPLQGVYSAQLLHHAQAGDSWAQYEMARCYLIGVGVKQDLKQAIGWFKLSADQGYTLGWLFPQGSPRDRSRSIGRGSASLFAPSCTPWQRQCTICLFPLCAHAQQTGRVLHVVRPCRVTDRSYGTNNGGRGLLLRSQRGVSIFVCGHLLAAQGGWVRAARCMLRLTGATTRSQDQTVWCA
jgi:Sel1 repeat